MKKEVMKRAWEIYRTLEGDRTAKLSYAMKQAWAEVKASQTASVEDKLISNGYTVWSKNGKERIYVNNLRKYLEIKKADGDVTFNGISVWDNTSRKSEYNAWVKKLTVYEKNSLGIDLYYDCKDKEWHDNNNGDTVGAMIVAEVVKAIESLKVNKNATTTRNNFKNIHKDDADYGSITGQHELGNFDPSFIQTRVILAK